VDAGNGSNQTIGATCNPSLSNACEQPSDVCSIAVCDPTTRVCTRVAVDAGPICSNGNPPVCSSDDCDAAVEAGDASDATVDASDASLLDGATDSTTDGAAGDASTDAPTDAGDSGGD
jgi:hypothetical protein